MVAAAVHPMAAAVAARATDVVTALTFRGNAACTTSASFSSSASSRLGGSCRLSRGASASSRSGSGPHLTRKAHQNCGAGAVDGSLTRDKGRRRIKGGSGGRRTDRGDAGTCRASSMPAVPPVETVSSIISDSIPAVMQQPVGLTFSQTMVYSACFAIGLMVLVGSLRPALVVLHNAWNMLWRGRVRVKPFTDSFYGWIYKILRTALLMVRRFDWIGGGVGGAKSREETATEGGVFFHGHGLIARICCCCCCRCCECQTTLVSYDSDPAQPRYTRSRTTIVSPSFALLLTRRK